MNPFKTALFRWVALVLMALGPVPVFAQDDDLRFLVSDTKGTVTVYRDETDETTRLRPGQKVGDGEKIIVASKSEAVLRLKGRAYVYLAPNTRVNVTRLQMSEKGRPQVRLNILQGRMICQMDKGASSTFEVSASKVVCRAHGTLFEVIRKKDDLQMTAFEGSVVTNARGHVEMAKPRQVMSFRNDRFRYKHYRKTAEESRLEAWNARLKEIREKKPIKGKP
jgi:hypothetical protein